MIWGQTTHRTLWADSVPEWLPVKEAYWHIECGVPLDFHRFTADPYLRPLLAICPGCGQAWERDGRRQHWRAVS